MKTLTSIRPSTRVLLSSIAFAVLSGCAAAPMFMVKGISLAGGINRITADQGVEIKFPDTALADARKAGFGAGATRIAFWPSPPHSRLAVHTTDGFAALKTSLSVVSPAETGKALKKLEINEFLDGKTSTDLTNDLKALCAANIADVVVTVYHVPQSKVDSGSAVKHIFTFGFTTPKSNELVRTTLFACRTQTQLDLEGAISIENNMQRPQMPELEKIIGGIVGKVVGQTLGVYTPPEQAK